MAIRETGHSQSWFLARRFNNEQITPQLRSLTAYSCYVHIIASRLGPQSISCSHTHTNIHTLFPNEVVIEENRSYYIREKRVDISRDKYYVLLVALSVCTLKVRVHYVCVSYAKCGHRLDVGATYHSISLSLAFLNPSDQMHHIFHNHQKSWQNVASLVYKPTDRSHKLAALWSTLHNHEWDALGKLV